MLEANITMLKYEELKDGPDMDWSVDLLARIIETHVISHSIDTVRNSLVRSIREYIIVLNQFR
jgi:hypothetical protein